MKKNVMLFGFISLILCVASSCSNDDAASGSNTQNSFMLHCISTGDDAPQMEHETVVNSMWLLFFEQSEDNQGDFVDAFPIKAVFPIDIRKNDLRVEYPKDSKLNNATAYNLLVVANFDTKLGTSIEPWEEIDSPISNLQGLTQEQVMDLYAVLNFGIKEEQNYIDKSYNIRSLLMSAAVKKEPERDVYVNLQRALARFDVACSAEGYTLRSASIWNAFPTSTVWNASFYEFEGVERIKRLYGVSPIVDEISGILEIKGTLYSPENYVEESEPNDEVTTCLIVGLQNNQSGNTGYYRINVNPIPQGQYIRRNTTNKINITNILKEGASTEGEAYSEINPQLRASINNVITER